MSAMLEVQLVALLTALACALPGVFLLLRRQSMMSDAIGHSVLPGIVIAFLVVGNLDSPLLAVGAALSGLAMVFLVNLLTRSGRVASDAALGLVFPALFSLAVLLVSMKAENIHLDTDAVLLGELAFAPFNRLVIQGLDLGPVAVYEMGGILLVNLLAYQLFRNVRVLAAFDPLQTAASGFRPGLIELMELGLVSLTCVGAFDAVGSILVVALMVAPAATARLLAQRVESLVRLALAVAALSAVSGWWLAWWLDASIAGSMAAVSGVFFTLALVFSPRDGLLQQARRAVSQRRTFARRMLCIHLLHHEGTVAEEAESRIDHLSEHLAWAPELAAQIVAWSVKAGDLRQEAGRLYLLNAGRILAREALEQLPQQRRDPDPLTL